MMTMVIYVFRKAEINSEKTVWIWERKPSGNLVSLHKSLPIYFYRFNGKSIHESLVDQTNFQPISMIYDMKNRGFSRFFLAFFIWDWQFLYEEKNQNCQIITGRNSSIGLNLFKKKTISKVIFLLLFLKF